jgi:hypothetical protein
MTLHCKKLLLQNRRSESGYTNSRDKSGRSSKEAYCLNDNDSGGDDDENITICLIFVPYIN